MGRGRVNAAAAETQSSQRGAVAEKSGTLSGKRRGRQVTTGGSGAGQFEFDGRELIVGRTQEGGASPSPTKGREAGAIRRSG